MTKDIYRNIKTNRLYKRKIEVTDTTDTYPVHLFCDILTNKIVESNGLEMKLLKKSKIRKML